MSREIIFYQRERIKPITGVSLGGIWRSAGAVYPIAPLADSHPLWKDILPQGWSMSWNTLPRGEVLEPHYHPVESFIAIVKGKARLTGQQERDVSVGNVLRVPAMHYHGFSTIDDAGSFWAITWQALSHSLYTGEDPNVFYKGDSRAPQEDLVDLQVDIHDALQSSFPLKSVPDFALYSIFSQETWLKKIERNSILFVVNGKVEVLLKRGGQEISSTLEEGDMAPLVAHSGLQIKCASNIHDAAFCFLQF